MSKNTETAWEDIVFDKRNKEYGAYAIRMSYSDNVLRGTLFVGLLVAMFIASSQFRSAVETVVNNIPNVPTTVLGTIPPIVKAEIQPMQQKKIKKVAVKPVYSVTTQQVLDSPDQPEVVESGSVNGVDLGEAVEITPDTGGETGMIVAAKPAPEEIFVVVEEMPMYVGGLSEMSRYLRGKLKYPSVARRQGTEGTVFVGFVVDGLGEVTDVKVIKGISRECDLEAVRVIGSMPKWKAGKQHNRFVSVRMVLPITFALAH